jgi:hypothetical protein
MRYIPSVIGIGMIMISLLNIEFLKNSIIINAIALCGLMFSIPGIINSLAEEYNPKKKKYKLTCTCPNCKELVHLDMEEM